jgi:hypothetical protein
MDISHGETKVLAFKGRDPIRAKAVIKSNITEKFKYFNCLGSSYAGQKNQNLESKLHNFKLLCGTVKLTELRKIQKAFLMFYQVLAVPILIYASEACTLTAQQQ